MRSYRTIVEAPVFKERMGFDTPALFVGSCFTQSIGGLLETLKFPVMINPFGIMYNPFSVGQTLARLQQGDPFTVNDLQEDNHKWFSFLHDTSFSGSDREKVLEGVNLYLEKGHTFFKKVQFLFLTFGTARVYEWKEDGRIVSNCHKLPSTRFRHRLLSPEEIVTYYESLLSALYKDNPDLQVIFTISPVRHWKDGATGNQVSKSVLFVAIHELLRRFPEAGYFPSYEMVMDDLRDYRFYDEDMIHLRKEAVQYIFDAFTHALIHPSAQEIMKEVDKVMKALDHRPFRPESEEYRKFLTKQIQNIERLKKKYPFLDFSEEKVQFGNR